MSIRMADVSEFQPNVDAGAYVAGGYTVLIVRAHNGYRLDNMWPSRRDYLRQYPFVALGYYQYLAQSRDAAGQARALIDCVGPLAANEFLVCDIEEGGGNQVPRAEAWFSVVDGHHGFPATLYSGLSFCRDHLGGWARWATRPRWLAAYQTSEPGDPHDLWQHSSTAAFPGIPGRVDSSIFHGTDVEFLRMVRRGARVDTPPPPGPDVADLAAKTVTQNKDGRLEEVVFSRGEVWHHWQKAPNGAWSDWASLGKP
jgi:GH25 family lysozyme M1 (1,4-beta-N-acetylmuramidase)